MDKLLLLIPTLSCTIFDFYRVMRPQGRITRFLFYFAEAGRPASWFAGQTMKKLTDMAEYSGRGRVTPSAVILAKRESHDQGQGGALSLPGRTNGGIPARSARMTAGFENACRYPGRTNGGIPARSARMTAENRGRGRAIVSTVILAKRGSHGQGLCSALSLPGWNQRWDSSVACAPSE